MPRPSKKIILLLVVAVVIVAGTFIYLHLPAKVETSQNQLLAEESAAQNAIELQADKDSDNDDLKDWEEVLWHTDPHNPDTDHDGTPDGEEVKESRDPALAGPNDKITQGVVLKKFLQSAEAPDLNPTERLSQDFFAEYLAARNSGTALSDDQKSKLIENIAGSQDLSAPKTNIYGLGDVKTSPDTSAAAIRNYGNTLGSIIIKNSTADLEGELDILQTALQNQDKAKLDELDPIIARYKEVIKESLTVNVPATAVNLQIEFLNATNDLTESISKMKIVLEDPVSTLKNLTLYSQGRSELIQAVSDFNTFFLKNGVLFAPNEYGYTFRPGL